MSDRCVIDVDPMVFVIWDVMYVFSTVYIDAIDESL